MCRSSRVENSKVSESRTGEGWGFGGLNPPLIYILSLKSYLYLSHYFPMAIHFSEVFYI